MFCLDELSKYDLLVQKIRETPRIAVLEKCYQRDFQFYLQDFIRAKFSKVASFDMYEKVLNIFNSKR